MIRTGASDEISDEQLKLALAVGARQKRVPQKQLDAVFFVLSDVDQNTGNGAPDNSAMEWKPISTAPFDRDLELAVISYDGVHALVFPCRRILGSWINAETRQRIDVRPTHWREWRSKSDR